MAKVSRTKRGNTQILGGGKTKGGVPMAFSIVNYSTPTAKAKRKSLITIKLKATSSAQAKGIVTKLMSGNCDSRNLSYRQTKYKR
jgi:hypothetical protein